MNLIWTALDSSQPEIILKAEVVPTDWHQDDLLSSPYLAHDLYDDRLTWSLGLDIDNYLWLGSKTISNNAYPRSDFYDNVHEPVT